MGVTTLARRDFQAPWMMAGRSVAAGGLDGCAGILES